MAAKSAIEMMLPQVLKAMGLDPEQTMKIVENAGAFVVEMRDRLERIERKLDIQNHGGEHANQRSGNDSLAQERPGLSTRTGSACEIAAELDGKAKGQ